MGRQPLSRRVGFIPQVTSFTPQGVPVSRTTFSRILDSARKGIADALLNGKAIIIEGGNFEVSAIRQFDCPKGNKWYIFSEHVIKNVPENCPRRKTSHSEVMQSCDRICDEMRFRRKGNLKGGISNL
jgi:hypothetical protein